jgi:hypothetical protein
MKYYLIYLLDKRSKTWLREYKIRYKGNRCVKCATTGKNHIKNQKHIFVDCQHSNRERLYNNASKKILELVDSTSKIQHKTLPWWFPVTNCSRYDTSAPFAKKLCNYNKLYGTIGVIPNTIKNFLKHYKIKRKKLSDH